MTALSLRAAQLVRALDQASIPAVLTPMTADRRVALTDLEGYASAIAAQPIGGVAAWVHTGRGPYLSIAERRRVLATFRAATAKPLVVGVAPPAGSEGDPVTEALAVAEEAVAGGADALLVFPPRAYADRPDRDQALLSLHERLAARTGLPLILFILHAAAGGYAYSPALLRDLLALPDVAGVKIATLDSAMTCQDVTTLVREEFPGRLAITGEDRMFGPSLMWGAHAALVGIAAACGHLTTDLLARWFGSPGQDGFLAASARMDHFAEVTFVQPIEGYVQRMLWAAEAEGVISAEAAHDPFGQKIPAEDRERVHQLVRSLHADSNAER
ncbi:MAG TPA: dihydrodipicolinate synthase family protein [Trebonia sp.]|nr:dihydrodipicolinate synthase family protein [Trebonia sp.]